MTISFFSWLSGSPIFFRIAYAADEIQDAAYAKGDQNKTDKNLRIRWHANGELPGLGLFIEALVERRRLQGVRNSGLIINDSGLRMSWEVLRNRFIAASALSPSLRKAEVLELHAFSFGTIGFLTRK